MPSVRVCLLASYTMLKNGEKMRICLSISRMNYWNAQLGKTEAEINFFLKFLQPKSIEV